MGAVEVAGHESRRRDFNSKGRKPMPLSLRPVAWIGDGGSLEGGVPIQFEVLGLPPGESALVGYPPYWRVLRIGVDVHGTWRGDFDSPEMALAALQRELDGAPFADWRMEVSYHTVTVFKNSQPFAVGHGEGFDPSLIEVWTTVADRGEVEAEDWVRRQYRRLFNRDPQRPHS